MFGLLGGCKYLLFGKCEACGIYREYDYTFIFRMEELIRTTYTCVLNLNSCRFNAIQSCKLCLKISNFGKETLHEKRNIRTNIFLTGSDIKVTG